MELKDVTQGTRVVYAGGDGQEHDAVALSAPLLGFSNAIHGGSHFVNLIFLDKDGNPVKVPAAALLTAGASADDLHAHAELTVAASRKPEEREPLVQAEHFRMTAQPRTIGWRPYRDDEHQGQVAGLTEKVSFLVDRNQELEADLLKANAVPKAQVAVPAGEQDFRHPIQFNIGGHTGGYQPDGGIYPKGFGPGYSEFIEGGQAVSESMSVKDKQLVILAMLADPDVAKFVSSEENSGTIGRVIADALAGEPVDGNDNPLLADTGVNEYNQLQMPLNLPSADDLDAVAAEANAHAETEQAPADPIPTVDVTLDPTEAGTESSSDTPVPTDAPSTLPEPSTDAPAEASPSSDPTPEIDTPAEPDPEPEPEPVADPVAVE